jgi:hypothetical protein
MLHSVVAVSRDTEFDGVGFDGAGLIRTCFQPRRGPEGFMHGIVAPELAGEAKGTMPAT